MDQMSFSEQLGDKRTACIALKSGVGPYYKKKKKWIIKLNTPWEKQKN